MLPSVGYGVATCECVPMPGLLEAQPNGQKCLEDGKGIWAWMGLCRPTIMAEVDVQAEPLKSKRTRLIDLSLTHV